MDSYFMLFIFGVWTPKLGDLEGRMQGKSILMQPTLWLLLGDLWHKAGTGAVQRNKAFQYQNTHPPTAHFACELWPTHCQCWWPIMMWWWTVMPPLCEPGLPMKTNPYFCGSGSILYCHRALTRSAWQGQVTQQSHGQPESGCSMWPVLGKQHCSNSRDKVQALIPQTKAGC